MKDEKQEHINFINTRKKHVKTITFQNDKNTNMGLGL